MMDATGIVNRAYPSRWAERLQVCNLRLRAIRDGLSLAALVALVLFIIPGPALDARAYWSFSAAHPYGGLLGTPDAFLYSPVAALVLLPFHLVPFEVFRLLLLAVSVGALALLVGPWALVWLAFVPLSQELFTGNIHLLLALAVVVGFRHPAAWSFVLLTKVTPGIGLLWFAVRREWRSLGVALGATLALAAASALLVPGWWPEWVASLWASATHGPGFIATSWWGEGVLVPLALRLPAAALLVVWGARTDRRWTVPVAAMLALPVVWPESLAMLVGVLPLARLPAAGDPAGG